MHFLLKNKERKVSQLIGQNYPSPYLSSTGTGGGEQREKEKGK